MLGDWSAMYLARHTVIKCKASTGSQHMYSMHGLGLVEVSICVHVKLV